MHEQGEKSGTAWAMIGQAQLGKQKQAQNQGLFGILGEVEPVELS